MEEETIDYRDLIGRFQSLSEDDQKALLWVVLDSMTFLNERIREPKMPQKEKREIASMLTIFDFVAQFLMKPSDFLSEIDFNPVANLLEQARKDMLEHESKKGKA